MDSRIKQLHDRATKGMALSPDEQAKLEAWYAIQDEVEGKLLAGETRSQVANLQVRIEATLKQISATVGCNQELLAQNNVLRLEIVKAANARK